MSPTSGWGGHGWGEIGAVFCGGMVGALLRAGAFEAVPHEAGAWPWATLIANVAGTAVLAWLYFHLHHGLPTVAPRRRLLETGLCGALTTFSTLQLELFQMLDQGAVLLALAYGAVSITLGLGLALAGVAMTRTRRKGRELATEPGSL